MQHQSSIAPLKFALVGCGRIAVKHIKAVLSNKEYTVVSITDVNPDAPLRLLSECGLSKKAISDLKNSVRFYTDFQEMLEKEKPEVTAITVPSGLHYQIGKAAILAGSHILLEKPMTMRSSEAKELYALSQQSGKYIAMGHIYRYFPVVKNLRADILSGAFGKISHGSVVVRWGHDQAYYDQAPWRGTWKSDGGSLMNQSVHALDLLCWLMGGEAVKASAMLSRRQHDMEAEDVAVGTLTLDNGSLCLLEGTTNSPANDHEATFYLCGSQGTIRIGLRKGVPFFDIRNGAGKKLNRNYLLRDIREKGLSSLLAMRNPHTGIYSDLAGSIHDGRQPLADAKSGLTSVEMVLAMYLSAKENRHVVLPLSTEVSSEMMSGFFPDDTVVSS